MAAFTLYLGDQAVGDKSLKDFSHCHWLQTPCPLQGGEEVGSIEVDCLCRQAVCLSPGS